MTMLRLRRSFLGKCMYSAIKQAVCWHCGHTQPRIQHLFCEECNVIQKPAQTRNFFEILEMEQNYALDMSVLQQKYRSLQTKLHPDKFVNRSATEREISSEFSALVNRAYASLSNPSSRGLHLLELAGVGVRDNESIADDAEFLMKVMELNEDVERAASMAELRSMAMSNQQQMVHIENEIAERFRVHDVTAARDLIIRMRYFQSLARKIDAALEQNVEK